MRSAPTQTLGLIWPGGAENDQFDRAGVAIESQQLVGAAQAEDPTLDQAETMEGPAAALAAPVGPVLGLGERVGTVGILTAGPRVVSPQDRARCQVQRGDLAAAGGDQPILAVPRPFHRRAQVG